MGRVLRSTQRIAKIIKDATGVAFITVISGAKSVSAVLRFAVRVANRVPITIDMRIAKSILKTEAEIICQKDAVESIFQRASAVSVGEGSRNSEFICQESAAHTAIQKITEASTLSTAYSFF